MEFIYGALCGAGILAIGICLSLDYDSKRTEYRCDLGLEDSHDES